MNRASRIACLAVAVALVPAGAEARKMRFGGSSSATSPAKASPAKLDQANADQTKARRGAVIVVPGIGMSSAKAGEPERVPFPPSTLRSPETAPPALRLSANGEAKKPWCGSEIVVGGFCVVN